MSRDRDGAGRPRNARPRDPLGRPLPRDSGGMRRDDEPALAPAAALRAAQQLLDEGQAFTAHEVLEAVWKAASGPERDLWRGLAQLAVGQTHRARGNEAGARALLVRGAETLGSLAGQPFGVPVSALCTWARQAATDPQAAGPMPRLLVQAADERA